MPITSDGFKWIVVDLAEDMVTIYAEPNVRIVLSPSKAIDLAQAITEKAQDAQNIIRRKRRGKKEAFMRALFGKLL